MELEGLTLASFFQEKVEQKAIRRFAQVRIADDYVQNYFILKRLTIYVVFEFAGKMHNPKMHQVQRPKEPGREKSPPIVLSEKICIW